MHSRTITPEIQYANLAQQGDTAQLGMWVFITTETLFFGALLFTYFLYRDDLSARICRGRQRRGAVVRQRQYRADHDQQSDDGAGDQCRRRGRRRAMVYWLIATALLGVCLSRGQGLRVFVSTTSDNVVPAVNFVMKPGEAPAGELFWVFYFVATGLHAIHLSIGIGLVLYHAAVAGPTRRDHPRLLCAARGRRAVLELCRYGLDLSVSGDLPGRTVMRAAA